MEIKFLDMILGDWKSYGAVIQYNFYREANLLNRTIHNNVIHIGLCVNQVPHSEEELHNALWKVYFWNVDNQNDLQKDFRRIFQELYTWNQIEQGKKDVDLFLNKYEKYRIYI
jgi:hypothetical protein